MIQQPIPSIKESPVVGSYFALNNNRAGFLEHLASLGDVTAFHMGPLPIVAFNRPEYMQSLLVEHADAFDKGWTMHASFVGNGVFISEGEFHRAQRKIMAPSFRPGTIASYADIMAYNGERLQAQWSDGQVVPIGKFMNAVTMSIIGKALFDEDLFSEADEMGSALLVVFSHAAHMMMHLPFALPANWPTMRNKQKDRAWAIIRNRLQMMIEERRAHPEKKRNDFLTLLMDARYDDESAMSDVQLMDECSTLFAGGQETVANAMIWTWYLLCEHLDIYRSVQQEVDTVLQGRTPTLDDLPRLPYCLQVYKEALRLYPPAPVLVRQALRACDIEGPRGTYHIKKGTIVLASIQGVHRQRDLFPQPETFNPDRFVHHLEKQLPRYGFMPFGGGPRICIGNHFALMEGHMLLATLAQRVTFNLVPGQRVRPSSKTLTTRPVGDVQLIVSKRSGNGRAMQE